MSANTDSPLIFAPEEPNVFHYLFIGSEKTPVCVCLYVSSGVRDAKSGDYLILPNLATT